MANKPNTETLSKAPYLPKWQVFGYNTVMKIKNLKNNYVPDDSFLSDEQYFELDKNTRILAKYLKQVIKKLKAPVDLRELETVLK